MEWGVLGTVCALVIGVYAYTAQSGVLESISLNAADSYYNLLTQGFRAGQLNLKKEVPTGFAQLADPYDPIANAPYRAEPYRMLDMSYYKGRLHFYFGVTPALILFWPFAALTGHYLLHRQAVAIFCGLGFLAGVGLLRALWRRYFADVSVGVVAACALALGLATGVPVLLSRSDVYEVAISCGYLLVMLALGALWRALHEPEPRKLSGWFATPGAWLAAASAAYGLAVGARPSLLFGAVILLVPIAQAWRERRPIGALLAAATGPIILIGFGLMLYNYLRFDDPFEFGVRYQLAADQRETRQCFSLHYLWFNFRVYFLEPVRWSSRFPFVREIVLPPVPPGHHGNVERPFGVLTNIPLVWVALTAPLAWRGRSLEARSTLRWFVTAVTLLFWIDAITLSLYYSTCSRFEAEFLPALVLLAVMGIVGLERALAPKSFGAGPEIFRGWLVWRRVVRWGWGLLLAFSVAFNLFDGIENYAESHYYAGTALFQAGKIQEAIKHYEEALRIDPGFAGVHNNLGLGLQRVGRLDEAIRHYEEALRLEPDLAEAHYNLGLALDQAGRVQEAIGQWEHALRIKPGLADPHFSLGGALQNAGRLPEAIAHYEQALRIRPDYADAHYNLGVALEQEGRFQEAIAHYQQALRIRPDHAEARNRLARFPVVQ